MIQCMTLEQILSVVQTGALILTIIVAVGTIRGRGDDKTVALTTMQMDIKYIKEKIENVEAVRDTAVKAKSSAESAHNRLNDHLRYDHHKEIQNNII